MFWHLYLTPCSLASHASTVTFVIKITVNATHWAHRSFRHWITVARSNFQKRATPDAANVDMATRSTRWGLRGLLVCNSTHHLWDGVPGGYLCATSHIIYEMGCQRGTCVQLHTSSVRWGLRGVLVHNFTHHLWYGISGGICVELHTSSMIWGIRRVLVCNFTHHLWDGVSGGYLCATSHIIYEMGSQGGTCVQLHTSSVRSMRWGLRRYLCATSHIIYEMGYQGGTCATSHIICEIYEMGSQGGNCVQLHTSSMRSVTGGTCVQLHTSSMEWGLRGVLVCNFTHHLWDLWDGVSEQYLCATSHIIYEMGSQLGTCVQLHTSSVRSMRWGFRGVLLCNFTHHLWDGISEGYLCATSHIIYEMGSQGGTCVQLHTSSVRSMRWGLRGILVCNFTHHPWDGVSGDTCVQLHTSSMRWGLKGVLVCNFTHHLWDGVSGGYLCATSHIIYEMGSQRGTCVQLHTSSVRSMKWGIRGVLVCNYTHHLWDGVSGGYLCATSHIIWEIYEMGYWGVLVCNFTHHLRDLWDGVSGGYLCATSHIIYEMGSQGGTCVQLHTSSMRWGIRGVPVPLHTSSVRSMRWGLRGLIVCNFTHHLRNGVSAGYLCATSHIIYEMGSQRGTYVQLHTSSMRWGLRGVLMCNFTHNLWDGVSRGVLVCNFTHHLWDLQDGVSGSTCVQLHT